MPFTLAHPAAVIPIYRLAKSLSLPALVIGSLSPDLPYFIPINFNGLSSHSAFAILWFCLPVSLLMYAVYFLLLVPVLAEILPTVIGCRLALTHNSGRLPDVPRYIVVVSVIIGAVTHILWDSFTHARGIFVQALPPLQTTLVTVGGYSLHTYKLLQHGSTIAGLGLLIYWATKRSPQNDAIGASPRQLPSSYRAGVVMMLTTLPLTVGLASGLNGNGGAWLQQLQEFLRSVVVATGGAVIAFWVIAGIVYRLYGSRI